MRGALIRLCMIGVFVALAVAACGQPSTDNTATPTPAITVTTQGSSPQELVGKTAAVSDGDGGSIHVFARGRDGHLYDNYWDGSRWIWLHLGSPPGDVANSDPTAYVFTQSGGHLSLAYCFVTGASGHLLVNVGPVNSAQRTWLDLGRPTNSQLTGRPAAISFGSATTLYAFVRGSDGHLYVDYGDGAQWRWADQGMPAAASVAGDPGVGVYLYSDAQVPRLYAFVRGSTGHLEENYWDGARWHWDDFGTPPATTMAGAPSVISYYTSGTTRFYVFVRGANGHLDVIFWDGARWNWADQGSPANALVAGDPTTDVYGAGIPYCVAAASSGARLYAFVRGSTGHLEENYWDGARWHWDDFGTPPGGTGTGDPDAVAALFVDAFGCTQRFYAFETTSGGHLAVDFWAPRSREDPFDGAWTWADQGYPSCPPTLVCSTGGGQ